MGPMTAYILPRPKLKLYLLMFPFMRATLLYGRDPHNFIAPPQHFFLFTALTSCYIHIKVI